jgi:hypothetical protein
VTACTAVGDAVAAAAMTQSTGDMLCIVEGWKQQLTKAVAAQHACNMAVKTVMLCAITFWMLHDGNIARFSSQ